MLCLALSFFIAACNGDDSGTSVVPPNQSEQTQTGGDESSKNNGENQTPEQEENNGENQTPEQEESDNKGKPVTPIQNGGTITTK